MRHLLLSCCIVASLTTVLTADIEKPPANTVQGNINWVYDYVEGQKLSHSSGKPMFVVFRCER